VVGAPATAAVMAMKYRATALRRIFINSACTDFGGAV
jgi:hypothetical protein